jgi:hypothetical protein
MVIRSVCVILVVGFLATSCPIFYAAEPRESLKGENLERLYELWDRTAGRTKYHDDVIKVIFEKIANDEDEMKHAEKLADDAQKSVDNQRDQFIELLLKMDCRQQQDGCALRKQVDDLQHQFNEWKRHQGNYQPGRDRTPPAQNVGPQSGQPRPSLAPGPPLTVWSGQLDGISDRRENFCPKAHIIRRHVKILTGDGDDNCIGDLYQDCMGRYVLLRTTVAPIERSVLLIPY